MRTSLFCSLAAIAAFGPALRATPTISFQNSEMSVSQKAGSLLVPVVITGTRDASNPSARFSTQNVTATRYTDFGSPSSINFGAASSVQNVVVPIYYTGSAQDRTFLLSFSSVSNCQIGSPASCLVTILAEAPAAPVTFALGASSVSVSQGAGVVQIPVSYTGNPSGSSVWVSFRTQPGTAKSVADYQGSSGSIDFQAGSNSANITVPVYNTGSAASKFFNIVLVNSSEGQLGSPAAATVTILGKGQSLTPAGPHATIRTKSVRKGSFTIRGTVVGVVPSNIRRIKLVIGGVQIAVRGKTDWSARVYARFPGRYAMVVRAYLKGGGTLTARARLRVHG